MVKHPSYAESEGAQKQAAPRGIGTPLEECELLQSY